MNGSGANEVSLYPSYSLVNATRFFVLDSQKEHSLIQAVTDALASLEVTSSGVNIPDLVKQNGLNIWGWLVNVSEKPDVVLEMWRQWLLDQSLSWPDSEQEIMERVLFTPGVSKDTDPYSAVGFSTFTPDDAPSTWICDKESGGKCKGFVNSTKDRKCKICKIACALWTCSYCSALNKIFAPVCLTCSVLRSDSEKRFQSRAFSNGSSALSGFGAAPSLDAAAGSSMFSSVSNSFGISQTCRI